MNSHGKHTHGIPSTRRNCWSRGSQPCASPPGELVGILYALFVVSGDVAFDVAPVLEKFKG